MGGLEVPLGPEVIKGHTGPLHEHAGGSIISLEVLMEPGRVLPERAGGSLGGLEVPLRPEVIKGHTGPLHEH